MSRPWKGAIVGVCAFLLPAAASAQASIAGVVRDTTGAVLPGVTVEASSPVLIEKVRSAVTDGSGQYRIVALDPGSYAVTFILTGFGGVRREGIELTGSFVATVNAELKVGSVQETITVTGETPLVDVQSSKVQQTLRQDVINALPSGRTYFGLAALVPGITTSVQDVGGIAGPSTVTFSIHGGPLSEGRLQVDGMSIGSAVGGSGVSFYVADVGHAQEIVFSTSGGLGEAEVGGPVMSLIPSTGANTIKGSFFANGANSALQGSNYTQALKDAGLKAPPQLIKLWDVNGAFGGPLVKDRLWYYVAARRQGNERFVTGMFYNQNAGNPEAWTYLADENRQAINQGSWKNGSVRMTVQPTARNKFNLFWDEQRVCIDCELGGSPTSSPEAAASTWGHPTRVQQITWTSPASTRVLLEAGFGTYLSHYGGPMRVDNPRDLVRVTEQAGAIPGLTYRSQDGANSHTGNHNWRASLSYVTGQHNLKVGYQGAFVSWWTTPFTNTQRLLYRLNNGVPNQLTMSAGTYDTFENVQTGALYAQDQSTFGRLTLQGAVRYDRASSQFLDQRVGPDRWIPTSLIFAATGRTVTDACAIRAVLPETSALNPYCRVADAFLTQTKWLGTYTIPRADVQLSATFQSVPGAQLAANYAVPNAAIAGSLGRNLSGNAANATVNLVTPGTLYGDRINQLDFRAGKVVRVGRTRTQVSLDLYNLLNTDATQSYNQMFVVNGAWLTPTGILAARFAKITAQLDF